MGDHLILKVVLLAKRRLQSCSAVVRELYIKQMRC